MKKNIFCPAGMLMVGMLVFIACNQQKDSYGHAARPGVSPDSLIVGWNAGWNQHDSIGIAKMFTGESIVVFSKNFKLMGADSIKAKWIDTHLPLVTNLQTEKIAAASSREMAYYTGTYSLDLNRNDSVIGTDKGSFTTVWKVQSDATWKIALMTFGPTVK